MENEDVVDLGYLFGILKRHLLFIVIIAAVCGVSAFAVAEVFIDKKYQSKAMLYVENNQITSESVNINDIYASQNIVNTCQIIFKSDTVMNKLIDNLGLSYTSAELNGMITAQSVNGTQVMQLIVETDDPEKSQRIVNELVKISNDEFMRIIKSGSIEVIDYGKVNTRPSSPNVLLITACGLLAGAAMAYVLFFIKDMFDVAVKHDDNLTKLYGIPVFAEVLDYLSNHTDGKRYYSGYGGYGNRKASEGPNIAVASPGGSRMMSAEASFAITEAYNAARTNIMFAASTRASKIIAVTSSNPSEGKSTTCSKIALSFANAGHSVLLVECDLRKPVMAGKFNVRAKYGLSSVLGGFCTVDEATLLQIYENLDMIAAGDVPPNPSELLSSQAMKTFLHDAAEKYDYVFLDTPPVNVVTDSQLFNDDIAGLVFVVREGSTTHPDIQSALEKITLANGKTLGFVKTFCLSEKSGGYGKGGSYSKYGYGYYAKGSDGKKNARGNKRGTPEKDAPSRKVGT